MKAIHIKTIPHKEQRYPTCGDYFETRDAVEFRISKLPDWRYEFLIAFHELFEYACVKKFRIPMDKIDAFDEQYEMERRLGFHGPADEPGNDPRAPYGKYHRWASRLERIAAWVLKVDWRTYENAVYAL